VSFTVEEERDVPDRHARPGTAIGIDLGVKTLLAGVDDQGNVVTVQGPKPLRAALHKATTGFAARYETVVVEDLNVTGMVSNRKLARAVSDQGFGTARRMLAYKSARHGGTLLVADRWYPSSKTCSSCGSVKAKLTLKDRIYACDYCGHTEDRDVNAARNPLSLAASGAERQNARGAEVRPGPAGHAVLKREPGTRQSRARPGPSPRKGRLRRERQRALNRNGYAQL